MNDYPGDPVRTEYKLLCKLRTEEPGLTHEALAGRLGCSASTVAFWLKRSEYQRYENWYISQIWQELPQDVRDVRTRVQEQFRDFAGEMQERLKDLIETTASDKVRLAGISEWLDRAGFAPVKKQETRGLQLVLTAEAVQMLQQRAGEAGVRQLMAGPDVSTD